jgi:putative nucleotidyltransferase with HDIG domain
MPGNLHSIVRIVFYYIIFSVLWIISTDLLSIQIEASFGASVLFQTLKGISFVFVSGGLIYWLLLRELRGREAQWQSHMQEKEQLLEQLRDKNKELLWAYNRTMEGWARVLEMRHREVKDHSRRVTEQTLSLARFMGLSETDLAHLRRGALLHDIGKMAIPDTIILKTGELSEEERAEIRRHPLYGYEMLSEIEFLTPALDILLCHHEKWNGEGYPFGLTGEQIPLYARIFAVVDVWDALLSDRSYHKAITMEEALTLIINESGEHFDPKVVEVFVQMLERDENFKLEQPAKVYN